MKKDWSKLTSTDKQRLAASFFHMNVDYRKSITGTVCTVLLVLLLPTQSCLKSRY